MIDEINQVFDANDDEKKDSNTVWNCKICTFSNASDASKCGVCGHAKSAKNDVWTCSRCTLQNQSQSGRCALCDALKPVTYRLMFIL